jgi:hypothetical protein
MLLKALISDVSIPFQPSEYTFNAVAVLAAKYWNGFD